MSEYGSTTGMYVVKITEKANPAFLIEARFESRKAAAAYAMRWKAADKRGWTTGRYVVETSCTSAK